MDSLVQLFAEPETSSRSSVPIARASMANVLSDRVHARRRFVYSAKTINVVTDGYMSVAHADRVLIETMAMWDLGGTNEEDREEITSLIAHALRQGTSGERDYTKVFVTFAEVPYCLDALKTVAMRYDNSDNPVRVWARSYKSGELAVRVFDMLNDPLNVELRNEATLDYGASMDYAALCFDFADALPRYPGFTLTQAQKVFIKAATVSKVKESRGMFSGSSDGGSVATMSGNAIRARTNPAPAAAGGANVSQNGTYEQRAGFAAMR